MLHISDVRKHDRCPKCFWLSRKKKKTRTSFLSFNGNMEELCKTLLRIGEDAFLGCVGDEKEKALTAMKTHSTLINARFSYADLRVKIPFFIQKKGITTIYFTYPCCYPKEREAQSMADSLSVLKLLGLSIDEVYVIHLNQNYIRKEYQDIADMLVINDCLFNSKNKAVKKIANLIPTYTRDIIAMIEELHACEKKKDIPVVQSSACTKGKKCVYFDDCFCKPSTTSILQLVQSSKKYDMLKEGIRDIRDVDIDRIEGTRHQYAQIMAAKHGGLYIDKSAIRCWLTNHIQYPLSYLDFEWDTYVFPPYKGMKPFESLAFQYSLHIEKEKGSTLFHREYIGSKDCREEFIQHLLEDIPKAGTILVYNKEGAEKLRLIQLARQFPQYKDRLQQIWDRMIDLSLPFSSGTIYHSKMAGFYSLKTLVPIFSDFNYQNLTISYGVDAVAKYRLYERAEHEQKEILYKHLSEYCSMDTYGEYVVYHAIEELSLR